MTRACHRDKACHGTWFVLVANLRTNASSYISNTQPRYDTAGDQLVGGDGTIQRFGSDYYLYMQDYGLCHEVVVKGSMCVFPLNHTCGYLYNHSVAVYRSSDLQNFERLTLDAFPKAPPGVQFRVKVVFNPSTQSYVMWTRIVPLQGGPSGSEPAWLQESYAVATSRNPGGPFVLETAAAPVRFGPGGDHSLFVDEDGQAYLVYTSHPTGVRVSVEKLTSDFLSSTNQSSGPFGPSGVEAPAMFKRGGYYYISFGPQCCYCTSGSSTLLFVAKHPLGPFAPLGTLASAENTHAQQNYVFRTFEGHWVWTGTRWGSAPDHLFAHDLQTWLPMMWDDTSNPPTVVPLHWVDGFNLNSSRVNIGLSGAWETVFNYTTDACNVTNVYGHKTDFSDSMPIAWFDAVRNETVLISANGAGQHANVGGTLNEVKHDCSRTIFEPFNSTLPALYASHQWIQSVRWSKGELYALIHSEFHGEKLNNSVYCSWNTSANGQIHPGPSPYKGECQLWSMGLAVRTGGRFDNIRNPPNHVVAEPPVRYFKDQPGPSGYGAISSLLEDEDGFEYGLVHVTKTGKQEAGNCAFRTSDISDPASFRGWNGSAFSVKWSNPYLYNDVDNICKPVTGEMDGSSHPGLRRLVGLPSNFPKFVLLGLTESNPHAHNVHGGNVTYTFSFDSSIATAITDWSGDPQAIELGLDDTPWAKSHVLYPALLDADSPSLLGPAGEGAGFELVGNRSMYLYLVLDRKHIVRRRAYFYNE